MIIYAKPCVEESQMLSNVHKECFETSWHASVFESYLKEASLNSPSAICQINVFAAYKKHKCTKGLPFESAQELLGFILGKTVADTNDLLTFAIKPSYQNLGIGRCLLELYLKRLQNCTCFLEVAAQNKKAMSLYESFGFQILSVRPQYYQFSTGLQDAYLMSKIL